MNIKAAIEMWLGIPALRLENAALRKRLESESRRISARIAELDKLTAIDVDIGMRGSCTVILSGVYRGKGYVQFYEMSFDEFRDLVEHFREQRRNHLIRVIDEPYSMRGSFDIFRE